jgi:hypothetical protein
MSARCWPKRGGSPEPPVSGPGWGNPFIGGTVLRIPAEQSPNFQTGVSGWALFSDGSAEFNNLDIRGTFLGTDYIINSAGAFFYGGPPGPTTLVMTISAFGGTDQYGTQYGPGFYFTDNDGAYASLAASAGRPSFVFQAGGLLHSTLASFLLAQAVGAGTAAEIQLAVLSSGKSGGDDAALQLFGEAADASLPARAVLEFGGAVALVATGTQISVDVPVFADSWHNVALDAGWTSTVTPQYRLLPDGNVQVRGQATHAGVTVLTSINSGTPLGAAYQPGAVRVYRPPTAGDAAGTVAVTAGGVLQMRASGFTATQAILDGTYSI